MRSGGARVWYLDKDGNVAAAFKELMAGRLDPFDATDPFWKLTPFVDFPGEYGAAPYRFEWEREWRVPGGLRFGPDDVSFLFIPEELHGAARSFFAEAGRELEGPNYTCPYLDPAWDIDRVQEVFKEVPRQPGGLSLSPDTCPDRSFFMDVCTRCGHSHGTPCHFDGLVHAS